jgi:hypothetical protein
LGSALRTKWGDARDAINRVRKILRGDLTE